MDILFIEDEKIASLGLTRRLQDAGHTVDHAETADDVIEHMRVKRYDLLLLDVMIPPSIDWPNVPYRESGKVLLQKLRKGDLGKLETHKNVQIVVITAISDVDVNMAISGFADTLVLRKPIAPEDAFLEIRRFTGE